MISPREFAKKWKELWGKEPIKFSADKLKDLEVDEEVKSFLMDGGLPDEAPLLIWLMGIIGFRSSQSYIRGSRNMLL